MHTQTNSKVRVKKDTIGDDGMRFLYEKYATESLDSFRLLCKEAIERSTGKRETKDKFIRELEKATSNLTMLKKVTNYFLAGQGLGV